MDTENGGGGDWVAVTSLDFGEGCDLYELESLKKQYERQLDALREELNMERQRRQGDDSERTTSSHYQQTTEQLKEGLSNEQKEHLDNVLSGMQGLHRDEVDKMHQKHVDDVNLQVKAMRLTLEQIYTSQLDLVKAELEQRRVQSLDELRHMLSKEHKEDVNRLEADWARRLEELEQQHQDELHDSILEESVGSEESKATYIAMMNQKLADEHSKLLKKISDDLDKTIDVKRRTPRKKKPQTDVGTDTDTDMDSIRSMPVTEEEYKQLEEREEVLDSVQDVRKTLESQREEIVQLRSMMLTEYEQLLSARTDSVSSQTEEVEKLQLEMVELQKHYEQQIAAFQSKVETHTEDEMRSRLSDQHSQEIEEMKNFYETKLRDLEDSLAHYQETMGEQLQVLKATQEEAIASEGDRVTSSGQELSDSVIKEGETTHDISSSSGERTESPVEKVVSSSDESVQSAPDKETTTPPIERKGEVTSPQGSDIVTPSLEERLSPPLEDMSPGDRIKYLESKLTEKETYVMELKTKIERDNKLFDDLSKKHEENVQRFLDFETELAEKQKDLDKMVLELFEKDKVIVDLKNGKKEMEEKCVKDMAESETKHQKELSEMKERLSEMQLELEAGREQERVLEEQYDELQHQHSNAIEALREDMEHESKVEIGSIQSEFKIQMEIELKRQAADLAFDHEEYVKQLELEHEDKINQLKKEYEQKSEDLKSKQQSGAIEKTVEQPVVEELISIQEVTQVTSPPPVEKSDVTDEDKISQEVGEDVTEGVQKEDTDSQASTVVDLTERSVQKSEAEPLSGQSAISTPDQTLQDSSKPSESGSDEDQKSYSDTFSDQKSISSGRQRKSSDTESEREQISFESEAGESSSGEAEAVDGLLKEIARAKEDTLKNLQNEYEQKISSLDNKLRELTAENAERENKIESLIEQLEDAMSDKSEMEQKFKDMESSLQLKIKTLEIASKGDNLEKIKQDLAKEYEDTVSQLHKEYEEKMELLRQELQETFDSEKEETDKKHKKDLEEAEERYDSLIEGMRSGDAPEVAELIRDRIDSELEMAKTLVQQEMEETLETEEARLQELHNEELEKIHAEREQEVEDLRKQHLKDLDECQKRFETEYEERINNLSKQVETLDKELLARLPEVAEVTGLEAPSVDETQVKVSDIEALEEKHKQDVAKIREEYESKLQALKSELPTTDEDQGAVTMPTGVSSSAEDIEDMKEKHLKEIKNMETRFEAKLQEQEDNYKKEIEQLQTRLGASGLDIPKLPLDHLDTEVEGIISSESDGQLSSVPTRSTPRDDMDSERSVDRMETTETLLPPSQITPREMSPRSDVDADSLKSDDLQMKFDSSAGSDDLIDERPGARMGMSRTDADMQFSSDDQGGPDTDRDGGLMSFRSKSSREKSDDTGSDRSTPPFMLQTKALTAESLQTMKPILAYEASPEEGQPGETTSPETFLQEIADKEARIKQLEEEIESLNKRLERQMTDETEILTRREREAEEGHNLVEMLRSDIDRVGEERDTLSRTNEQLLQLLSDTVKTYMSVEEAITKKLTKVIADGETSQRSRSPTGLEQVGAEGGEPRDGGDVPQETSILSNITDEGLDLSQRISESLFMGPELDNEGEELITDASQRLQGSVNRLLDMIEDTTRQLQDSKQTQHDLVTTVSSGQQESESLATRCQELEERMGEEVAAKEYLALELHKAEGLIEGYSLERENLEEQIQDLEEKKEALVLELETTRNKLQDLEGVRHEAESLREEIQRQQNIIQERPADQAQVATSTSEVVPPSGEALTLEVHRINEEKRELEDQMRRLQERYETRLRKVEGDSEESERHYFGLLEEKKTELQDLRLQLDSVEKQLKSNKQFLEEQGMEREQEREEFSKELEKWKQMFSDKEKKVSAEHRLKREVDDLTEQLQSRIDSQNEIVQQTAQLQRDLQDREMSEEEMRALLSQLEQEVEEKANKEKLFSQRIENLEVELKRQKALNEEMSEDLRTHSGSGRGKDSDVREVESPSSDESRHKMGSHMSLQQEEELLQENEALQSQLEDQMKQISALKNQLDQMRLRGDMGENSQAATLQRQLERQSNNLEDKEKQLNELTEKVQILEEDRQNKDRQISQLSSSQASVSSTPSIHIELDGATQKIEAENTELRLKIKSLQGQIDSTPMPALSQSLIKEKNQELDHLNDQINQLRKELDDARSGQEIVELRREIDRQNAELSKKQEEDMQLLRASQASYSDSDVETPGGTLSFGEKTNLQQEIEDSFANKFEEVEELKKEIDTLKESLKEKEDQIVDLQGQMEGHTETTTPGEQAHEDLKQKELDALKESLNEKQNLILDLKGQLEGHIETTTPREQDYSEELKKELDTLKESLKEREDIIINLKGQLEGHVEKTISSEQSFEDLKQNELDALKELLKEKEDLIIDLKGQLEGHADTTTPVQQAYNEDLKQKEAKIAALTAELSELQEANKTNLQQDVEDSFTNKIAEVEELKKELDTLKESLKEKDDLIVNLKGQLEGYTDTTTPGDQAFKEDLKQKEATIAELTAELSELQEANQREKDEYEETVSSRNQEIASLKKDLAKPRETSPKSEDSGHLQEVIQEKEALIEQMTIQMESLNTEVDSLNDFQTKLSEDFDTVQSMLEEKEKEIDILTKELTEKTSPDMMALEIEVTKLKKELREKDNVIEEKAEEMYLLNEKLEQQHETSVHETSELEKKLTEKELEARALLEEKETELKLKEETMTKMQAELDAVQEHLQIAANLQQKLEAQQRGEPWDSAAHSEELQRKDEEILSLRSEITRLKEDKIDLTTVSSLQSQTSQSPDGDKDGGLIPVLARTLESPESSEMEEVIEAEISPEDVEQVGSPLDQSKELQAQVEQLQNELATYKNLELSGAIEAMKEKEEEIAILREALKAMKSQEGDMSSVLEDKSQALQKIEGELESYRQEDESQASEAVLEEKMKEVMRLQTEVSDLRSQLEADDKVQQIESLEKKLQEHTENNKQLQDEVDWLQQQVDSLRDMRLQEGDVVFNLQAKEKQVEVLQKEINAARNKMSEAGVSPPPPVTQGEDETWANLQSAQSQLEQTSSELSSTVSKLQESEEKLQELNAQLMEKDNECKSLQGEYWQATAKLTDAIGAIQEKEEKLSQTSAQLSEREEQLQQLQGELQLLQHESDRQHHLQAKETLQPEQEQELHDLKQKLKEAVEISEQQLHIVEQKEQEYVLLKLELQQLVSEKDKMIRRLKQQVQNMSEEKEDELMIRSQKDKVIQNLEQQNQQLRAVQERSGGGGDALSVVADLQSEIQEREEAVSDLQKELKKTQMALDGKSEELENILEDLQTTRMAQAQNEKELGEKCQELNHIYSELHDCKLVLQEKVEEVGKKAKELETKAQEVAALRGLLPSGEVSEVVPETAQKIIEQLQMELSMTKATLEDVKSQASRKDPPVLRLRAHSQDSDDNRDLEFMGPDELRENVLKLTRELRQASDELELFHSTASMSTKDYVKKVMELREELSDEHQRHVADIQERMKQEMDMTIAQLRIRYEDELEHLRKMHEKELDQKVGDAVRELTKKHKTELNKIIAKHHHQLELVQIQEPLIGVQDTSLLESGVRSQQFDPTQTEQLMDNGDSNSTNTSLADSEISENISGRLQMLIKKLKKEGVQMLSLSELQFLNQHMADSRVDKEADVNSLKASWENEKQGLLSAIQSLKDLLAQTHKLRGLDKGADISDWRAELLQSVGYVFARERENLLAELRTSVMSQPDTEAATIIKLEQKIRNQEEHQRVALEQVFDADRQSMLAEVRDLRAHNNISSIRYQEERQCLSDSLSQIEEQSDKRERQLKRQVQLLEYKLQQEKIIQDDLRTSIECERERTAQLSGQLSREKHAGLDLHTDVSILHMQIAKLKDALEKEQSRFVSVTHMWDALVAALEEEKGKNQSLNELLESERLTLKTLQNDYEDVKVKGEVRDKIESTIENLQSQVVEEREKRRHLENVTELEKVKATNLYKDLELERKNSETLCKEFDHKAQQIVAALEIEKARSSDLASALERERELSEKLKDSLDLERASLRENTDREKSYIHDMQIEVEMERAKVNDLKNALEREKRRMSGMTSAIHSERTALRDELEQEKTSSRQLKQKVNTLELQKMESSRLYEHERDQVLRLKGEIEKLRSDLKATKYSQNEHERLRDKDKITEKRRNRELERERDDQKMKLHEQELEIQRLSQKMMELKEQLALSQEKEISAIRDFEQERLRNLRSDVYNRPQSYASTSPRHLNSVPDHWNVYKTQLRSMSQSLEYLILQYKNRILRANVEGGDEIHRSLSDLLTELKQLELPLAFESQVPSDTSLLPRLDPKTVNDRLMKQNVELTNFVSRITEEKMELRNSLTRLEGEVWGYRQHGHAPTQNGGVSDSHLEERANWAKERLSLELALNQAEHQIDQLNNDLRIERERRVPLSNGAAESDKDKMQRLYGKYLRAESFRKALVYQKKYLLLLLGGFQDCEDTVLALIAQMGAYPSVEDVERQRPRSGPYTKFRSAVRVVIAISRMKYMVRKWRRATRVGSPVHGGRVDTQQAYMPSSGSFSPPRINGSPRVTFSATAATPRPTYPSAFSQDDSGSDSASTQNNSYSNRLSHMTPPTREPGYQGSQPTTGARRKLISSSGPTPKSSATQSPRRFDGQESLHDDYIKRLESLQKTLGSMGSESPRSKKYQRR